MTQDVVWGYAGLTAIQPFAEGYTSCCKLEVAMGVYDDGRLSSKFEGDWSQMLCSLLHDHLAYRDSSCEEYVVKLLVEQGLVFCPTPCDDCDILG